MLLLQVLHGHKSSVRSVKYSHTGRFISSVALDGEVKLWSATNGSQVRNAWPMFDCSSYTHVVWAITGIHYQYIHRLKVGWSDGTMVSIRFVNEYPTMDYFQITKYTRSKIAYKVLTEYIWKIPVQNNIVGMFLT